MAKALEQMTVAELKERLLELRLAEEVSWATVTEMRRERAEIELLLYRREQQGGKK